MKKILFTLVLLAIAGCSSAEVSENPAGGGDCGLSKQEIDTAIRAHFAVHGVCYEPGEANISGRIVTHFDIFADGTVKQPGISSSNFHDSVLESCLLMELRKTTFPAVRCGGSVTVDYPFVFTPKN